MRQKATTGFAVLVGLVLGVAIAYGGLRLVIRMSLKMMRQDAIESFEVLEVRLQRMADGALRLQKVMVDLGWKGRPADSFPVVEHLRSLLAGNEEIDKKAEWAMDLEHHLLDAQVQWEKIGAQDPAIARDYYYEEHLRWWTNELRWLKREEDEAKQSFNHYNQVLRKWPFRQVARNEDAQKVARDAMVELQKKKDAAAEAQSQEEGLTPAAATAEPAPAAPVKPVVEALPELVFEDAQPWPEEYYAEVQYRPMPSMLEVQPEEEAPLLERDQNKPVFEKIKVLGKEFESKAKIEAKARKMRQKAAKAEEKKKKEKKDVNKPVEKKK
jgi:hypothetical protein